MTENSIPPRRRSPRRIIKGAMALAVIAAALAFLVYTPIFTFQHVALDGASYLKEDDIVKIADIHRGEPLFTVKTDEVALRLRQDLRIEDAQVRRVLPHTLAVHITERRPVATVATDYGYADLDRTGKILFVHKSLSAMQIPILTGLNLHEKYIGDDAEGEHVQDMLAFLGKLSPEAVSRLSELSLLRPDYLVAYTTSGVQIRLGAFERMDEKAKLTQGFLNDQQVNPYPVEYVDFSYTSPVIKLRKPLKEPEDTGEITE